MRRALTILLAVFFFAPALSARSKSDWTNVEKLKLGSTIVVVFSSGERLRGRLEAADDAGLWLARVDRRNFRIGSRVNIDRASVRKIERFREPRLPDVGKWMLVSALAGGVIGVVSGAIYDGVHHSNEAHWLTGGLGGAGMGFFASCAVLAGIVTIDVIVEIFHPTTLVYEVKPSGAKVAH